MLLNLVIVKNYCVKFLMKSVSVSSKRLNSFSRSKLSFGSSVVLVIRNLFLGVVEVVCVVKVRLLSL